MAPRCEQPEVGGVAPPGTSAVAARNPPDGHLLAWPLAVVSQYDSDTGGGHVASLAQAAIDGRQPEDITCVLAMARTCSCRSQAESASTVPRGGTVWLVRDMAWYSGRSPEAPAGYGVRFLAQDRNRL